MATKARKSKPLTAKSAWLITWEGTDPPPKKLVTILNYRRTARQMAMVLENLYPVLHPYSGEEKLRSAISRKKIPYPAELSTYARATCSANPHLYCRYVTNLRFEGGSLRWDEPMSPNEIRAKHGLPF
jgi:hypothetical protein